jgi:hypothetical protein
MKLRRLDKQGKEIFVKDYSKQKSLAESILKNSSTYNTGEKMWEVIPDAPKAKGRPKKNKDEDSKE